MAVPAAWNTGRQFGEAIIAGESAHSARSRRSSNRFRGTGGEGCQVQGDGQAKSILALYGGTAWSIAPEAAVDWECNAIASDAGLCKCRGNRFFN